MAAAEDTKDVHGETVLVRAIVRPEDDHWSAVATDYAIVGVGETPEAALDRMATMLGEYLALCLSEGMTINDARRPVTGAWRAKLEAALLAGKVTRIVHRHRPQGSRDAPPPRPQRLQVKLEDVGHNGHLVGC